MKKIKENKYIKNLITAVFAIAVYLIFGIMSFPNKDTVNSFNTVYYVLSAFFTVGVMIFLYFDDLKKDFKEFFKKPAVNLLKCFLVFLVCFIIVVIGNNVTYLITNTRNANTIFLIFPNMKMLLYYTMFVMVFYMPFVESMVFDKALHKIFNNKILFVILSGILFGLMQIGLNFSEPLLLVSTVPYMIIQMIIASLYLKKENVFFPIFTWVIYYIVQVFIQYMVL